MTQTAPLSILTAPLWNARHALARRRQKLLSPPLAFRPRHSRSRLSSARHRSMGGTPLSAAASLIAFKKRFTITTS